MQAPIMEKSLLLPLKKRRGAGSGADDSLLVPPKKRLQFSSTGLLQLEQTAGSDAAYGATVETHRHDDDTATAKNAGSTQQPWRHQQKLVHVGVRSGGETPAAQARKNTKTNRNRDKRPSREAVPLPPVSVDRPLRLGAELARRLEELGVGVGTTAPPRFVCMKTLKLSDVSKNQNRLLISCKPECLDGHAITALFAGNAKETYLVHDCEAGLRVGVLDGRGAEFRIRLRYLESNGGYRFITEWGAFVEANGLDKALADGRRVEVELWAFRSPRLPAQPVLGEDKADEQRLIDSLEGHPDGVLGLLFLPYFDRAEEEEPRPPAPVRETKRQASAKVVRQEKKTTKKKTTGTADHVHHERANRQMTLDEVVTAAGPQLADSLIGFLMLSSSSRCRSSVPTTRSNAYAGAASFQQVAATHKE